MNNLNGQPGRTQPVRLRFYQQDAVQNLCARLAVRSGGRVSWSSIDAALQAAR